MLTVIYDPKKGLHLSDYRWMSFIKKENGLKALSKYVINDTITVCNEIAVNVIRVLIRRGEIKHDEIKFEFTDQYNFTYTMNVDECGNLDEWPNGFCDNSEELLIELLGIGFGKNRC